MFKITIEGSSVSELKSNLLAAAAEIGGAAASDSKPKAAAAPKAAPAAPKTPELDLKKDVSPLILKLADISREKAIEVLGTFGVSKGADLKPEQYAEAVAALKAAIETAELG